jgi:hypothetical protein
MRAGVGRAGSCGRFSAPGYLTPFARILALISRDCLRIA